jgi:hypothetical protein
MKTVITLDPEYIPWEPGNPVVRLRRKRNKTLAAVLGIGFAVVICGGMAYLGSQQKAITEPPHDLAAAPVPTAMATPGAIPTPALITRGQPGRLAVMRGNVVSFFPCETYMIRAGETIVETGDTENGPVVDVTGHEEVVIECEHETFKY